MKVPNIGILMFAAIVILGVFNAADADARLDARWLDERGFGHMIEVNGKPYVTIGYHSAYFMDYTDPVQPMIVSRSHELFGFPFITDFEKDGRTYVATTGATDDLSITFVDITDIYRTKIVSKVSYGDEGFDSLAYGTTIVGIVEKNGRTYAITFADGGVLVIDITDIENPKAASHVSYPSSLNMISRSIIDMNVVDLADRTYLLAPSESNDGTPAIDITDPLNPVAVKSPLFYADGINVLAKSWSIDVFEKDGGTYAAVSIDRGARDYSSAEFKWDGNYILNITDPAAVTKVSIFDAPFRSQVRVHEIGGSTYVVAVADLYDSTVTDITDLENPRTVSILDTNNHGGLFEVVDTGGKTYVVVEPRVRGSPGLLDTFDITDPANPIEVVHTLGGGFYATAETRDITITEIDGRTYAMSAGHDERGAVQIVDITSPSHAEPVHAMFHEMEGFEGLYRAWGIDVAHIDGRAYAVVAGEYDGGSVQVIDVTNPKVPSPVSIVTDEQGGFGHLADPWDVAVAEVNGRHYAVTASREDNAMQVIDITNPAAPRPAGYVGTDTWPQQIKVAELNGKAHAIVMTSRDSGIQVIDISNPRNPVIAGSSSTGDALSLDVTVIDGRTYALVAGRIQGGGHLTIKEVTNPEFVTSAGKLNIPWVHTASTFRGGFGYGAGADGPHAFFTGGEGTYYIDISNHGSPEIVSKSGQPGSRVAVHVVDGVPYALRFSMSGMGIQAYDNPGKIYGIGGFNDGRVPAISDPDIAISAIFDGHNGFETLAGVNSIVAIKTGNCSHAIAGGSDGIQVIDLSDPFKPEPVSSIDGMVVLDMELVETIDGKRLVVDTADGVVAFDVADPAMPVQVAVNTGLTEISSDDGRIVGAQLVYLSGESTIVSSHQGIMRVVDGYTIDAQRLDAMLAVENATAAALAEIDGVVYGLVAAVGYYPERDADFHAAGYAQKIGNLLVYDVTDPHNPTKIVVLSDIPLQDFIHDPQHVETFEIAGTNFVVGLGTRSSVIVDITDPYDPWRHTGAGSGDDGSNFRALAGASDFDVIVIDGRLYGLVAATEDNGVQVMDITYLVER